jgi:hypothetical protein
VSPNGASFQNLCQLRKDKKPVKNPSVFFQPGGVCLIQYVWKSLGKKTAEK